MDTREILYRLLYQALVELREEGHTIQNKKLFHLTDLLHTLPLQLERIARDGGSYDELLAALRTRAQEKGVQLWLDKVVDEGAKSP